MGYLLDTIGVNHINAAADFVKSHGVDDNKDLNNYFVEVGTGFYPFKFLVAKAYQLATGKEISSEFQSNPSNRDRIRNLGYNIKYIKDGIKYSEFAVSKLPVENKMARIIWNTHGWETPSGYEGKSRTKSYENSNGFGHEEWNFNRGHQLGEYKYGFLEPINKCFAKYSGNVYHISLFTRNRADRNDFWVTTLHHVEVISKDEAQWVLREYKRRGWFDEMKKDLEAEGLDGAKLDEWIHDQFLLFNIKFKASQLYQLEEPIPIEDKNRISCHRYSLLNISSDLRESVERQCKEHGTFDNSGTTDCEVSPIKLYRNYRVQEQTDMIEIGHGRIQQEFMRYLQGKYGKDNVKRECRGYGMSRIDIERKTPEGIIFYEVKSYNNLLTSLRHSIGQLLEYCLYPNVENARELVLVSDIDPRSDKDLLDYINHVRGFLKIPFSYICFDPEEKKVRFSNMVDEEYEG